MDHEGHEDLLRRATARVDASHAGDAAAISGDDALADADALLHHIDGAPDSIIRLQYIAGMLHWNRWCVLGEVAAESARRAELLLTPLYFVDRSGLPPQLAEYLDTRYGQEGDGPGRLHEAGIALVTLATELDRPVFLGPAIAIHELAVDRSGPDDPRRWAYLWSLATALLQRYDTSADDGDLQRSIPLLREACRLAPADEGELVPMWGALGRALVVTAERSDDPAPLQEAVEVSKRALPRAGTDDRDESIMIAVSAVIVAAGRPAEDAASARAFVPEVVAAAREAYLASSPDDPLHPTRSANMALALDQVGGAQETSEAVRLACAAITLMEPAEPLRLAAVAMLRNRLLLDGESPLDDEAFLLATTTAEELAAASRPDDADHALCVAARAAARQARSARGDGTISSSHVDVAIQELAGVLPDASRTRLLAALEHAPTARREPDDEGHPLDRPENLAQLDASAAVLRNSLAQVPVNRVLVPKWLKDLAGMLRQRVAWRPEPAVVDEAIEVHRRLLAIHGPDADPELTLDLAFLLGARSSTTGDLDAASEAATLADGVLQGSDLDPATRERATGIYGNAMLDLARATPDAAVAHRAEAAFRALVDTGEPAAWHNLAIACWLRYERTGTGLSDAIAASRRAVALGGGSPSRQQDVRVAFLAQALATDGQLDEALALARDIAAGRDGEAPSATVLDALGNVLHRHHVRFGGTGELDEAIAALRAAARADDPTPTQLATLASALRARYTATGDLASLEEAIATGRRALWALPAGHEAATLIRANLAVQLSEHHRRTGDEESLTEAILTGREVVAATASGHPMLSSRLCNLARALGQRFERVGDRIALEEAIALERRAAAITPPGHPERGMWLSNLAVSLSRLQEATGSRSAGGEAERVSGEAVAATPADHPSLAHRLVVQANAVASAGWLGRRRIRRAARIMRTAARLPSAPPSVRLTACKGWGQLATALREWDDAAEAFAEGVRLLPRLAGRSLRRPDAEHQLTRIDGVHVNAAACAVQVGDPAAAVTLLEQGRGVLLSYALDTRTELTDLHAAEPELGAKVERLVRALDTVDDPLTGEEGRPSEPDDRHALAGQWDDVIAQVRTLPKFARFAAPPAIDDLLPVAGRGPVVVVNVSEHRCDALVVTPRGVQVVPLTRLTDSVVAMRARSFLTALDVLTTGDLAQRMEGQATVRRILGWLWDDVAEPVLDAIGHTQAHRDGTPWPRVWWSPTGMLNFLPLHAAGHHGEPGRAVLDRVVSSYTPTLRAMQHARSRPAAPDPALLAVAMSETPGQPPLPATVAEAQSLGGDAHTVRLTDADARYEAVADALGRCGWAHFACHAVSDPLQPSDSRLLLHDRAMAVRDVGRLRLQNAELAFLAACSTARGSEPLADEAIHIASAFQLAGFRNVVGTLWPALDATSARLAAGFYQRLRSGAHAAEALHDAVRELRAEQPLTPSAWAGYVHAGP